MGLKSKNLVGRYRAQDIAKLKGAGYSTIVGVQQATRKTLTKIKVSLSFRRRGAISLASEVKFTPDLIRFSYCSQGLSEIKVDKIKDTANKIRSSNTFITAAECSIQREKIVCISTGSKSFDAMLGGGIKSQSMTEGKS